MDELFSWYLAPWRKIGRGPFNTAVFVVAIPGLILWFMGFGQELGGIGGLFTGMGDMGQQVQGAVQSDTPGMTNMVNNFLNPPAQPHGIAWGDIGGWVDSLLWLLCLPLVRMRARDLGYSNSSVGHWVWVAAAFAGTLPDLLQKLGVPGMGSISTWGSAISFVALLVMCTKHAPAVERDENFIYTPPPGDDPHGPAKGTGEPKQW